MSQLLVDWDTSGLGWLAGSLTLVFMTTFVAFTWWAYNPANRAMHEETGRMPLDGGES